MKITLLDINSAMVAAWREICGDLPGVEVVRASFEEFEGDAIVSPANSFGYMDGGIDHAFSEYYGWDVQERLQTAIKQRFHGELHVGQAVLVAIKRPETKVKFVISAPTMRSPMVLGPITLNPYLATRAALIVTREMPDYGGDFPPTVCFPGMGTGVGNVPFRLCAHQMRRAIEQVVLKTTKYPDSWIEATDTTDDLLCIRGKGV